MTSIRPLSFARLNSSHAEALRTLGASAEGVEVQGLIEGASSARIRLSPIASRDLPHIDSTGYLRLSLEWAGGRILFDLPPESGGAWLRAVLGAQAYAALPPHWMEPALAHAVERASALIEPQGRGPLQLGSIRKIGADENLVAGFHALWFELAIDSERLQGLLQLDSMSLLLLSSLMPPALSGTASLATPDMPIPLVLAIGHTDLDIQQLQRLKPKGVVLIAQPYSIERGGLQLQSKSRTGRGWMVEARLEGDQLLVSERPRPMSSQIQSDNDADTEVSDLGQLPVRLSFDLGERVITLAELQALDQGSALPLGRPLQDFVTIRANGAIVGEGQLVDMDGRLGVMVSRLSLPSPE